MKSFFAKHRPLVAGALTALATLPWVSNAAAREFSMILLDRSGSMSTPSLGTPASTRWEAAKQVVLNDLEIEAPGRIYAIWTFDGSTYVEHVPFSRAMSRTDAQLFIRSGALGAPGDATPLAGAVCDAVDALVPNVTAADDLLFLNLYSDGLENHTDPSHPCAGPSSPDHANPTDPLTWEYKVFNKVFTGSADSPSRPPVPLIANASLLFSHEIAIYAAPPVVKAPNQQKSPLLDSLQREGLPIPPDIATFPGQELSEMGNFFRKLAQGSGGRFRAFAPTSRLPVPGDVNGDYCVDKRDLTAVTVNMGRRLDRNDPLDLNQNGVVDTADEKTVQSHLGKCNQ